MSRHRTATRPRHATPQDWVEFDVDTLIRPIDLGAPYGCTPHIFEPDHRIWWQQTLLGVTYQVLRRIDRNAEVQLAIGTPYRILWRDSKGYERRECPRTAREFSDRYQMALQQVTANEPVELPPNGGSESSSGAVGG